MKMKMKKVLFSLFILAAVVSCKPRTDAEKVSTGDAKKAAELAGAEYSLVPEASVLKWIGSKPGGEHNGTVKISEGKLSAENGNITAGSFVFDMNTIVCDDLTDEAMNTRLVNHLRSEDFFHVSEFPTAAFEVVSASELSNPSVTATGGVVPTHNITGNLTIKGVTKSITFPAKVDVTADKVTAVANPFSLNRTEWNVNFMSKSVIAGLKDNFIDDNMILSMELEFVKY